MRLKFNSKCKVTLIRVEKSQINVETYFISETGEGKRGILDCLAKDWGEICRGRKKECKNVR